MPKRNENGASREFDPRPESGMGGASDMGAHGSHPASSAEAKREGRSPRPEDATGDAIVERRRGADPSYQGPERRVAQAGRPGD
jgi:hypothetical protein